LKTIAKLGHNNFEKTKVDDGGDLGQLC